jgi:hypothetical protein
MDARLDEVLAVSRTLIALEEEERSLQIKIATARQRLSELIGQDPSPKHLRKHRRTSPMPGGGETGLDPALGDYGSRGGYGQRGKTGEILAYMRTIPEKFVSPEDVVNALNWNGDMEANYQIASRMLQRLAQAGKLTRPHRGLYQLKSEPKKED